MFKRVFSLLLSCILFSLLACSQGSEPKHKLPELEKVFKSISEKVVFVTKDIYGGELKHNAILRGKVKNISWFAQRDVMIIWAIYAEDGKLFPIRAGWEL